MKTSLPTRVLIALRKWLNGLQVKRINGQILKYKDLYEVKETIVLKKKYAPRGKCFLVVTYRPGKVAYVNSVLVSIKGQRQEVKDRLAHGLFMDLLKRYDLKV